jgi:hypothetical protein
MERVKPKIGRIVRYRIPEGVKPFESFRSNGLNEGDYLPAVVVRVWNEDGPYADLVNLSVFTDGGGVLWATSVHEGDAPGEWSWPPRD